MQVEAQASRVRGFELAPSTFRLLATASAFALYVIIVSGRGEVDVVGGKKVQLAPGRVLLAEDVTGKGHTTRVGADEDLVMLLVPLAQEP